MWNNVYVGKALDIEDLIEGGKAIIRLSAFRDYSWKSGRVITLREGAVQLPLLREQLTFVKKYNKINIDNWKKVKIYDFLNGDLITVSIDPTERYIKITNGQQECIFSVWEITK